MDQQQRSLQCLLVRKAPGWFLVPLRTALQQAAGDAPGPILPIPWITGGQNDHNLGYFVLIATGATFLALLADCTCRYLRRKSKSDKETTTKQYGIHRELKLSAWAAFANKSKSSKSVTQVTTSTTTSTSSGRQKSKKRRAGEATESQEEWQMVTNEKGRGSTNQLDIMSPEDEGVYSMNPSPSSENIPGGARSPGRGQQSGGVDVKSGYAALSELKQRKTQEKKTTVTVTTVKTGQQGDQTSKKVTANGMTSQKIETRNKHTQVGEKRQETSDRGSSPVRHKRSSKTIQTETEPAKAPAMAKKKTTERSSSPVAFKDISQKTSTNDRGCSPVRFAGYDQTDASLMATEQIQGAAGQGQDADARTSLGGKGNQRGGKDRDSRRTKQTVTVTTSRTVSKAGGSYADVARGFHGGGEVEQEEVSSDVTGVAGVGASRDGKGVPGADDGDGTSVDQPAIRSSSNSSGSDQFEMVDAGIGKGTQTDITGDRYIFDFSSTAFDINVPSVGLKLQEQEVDDQTREQLFASGGSASSSSINSASYVNVSPSPTSEYVSAQLSDRNQTVDITQLRMTYLEFKQMEAKQAALDGNRGKSDDEHKFTQTVPNDDHKNTQTEKKDESKITQTTYSDESKDVQTDKNDEHKITQTSYSEVSQNTQTEKKGEQHKEMQTVDKKSSDTPAQTDKNDEHKDTQTDVVSKKQGQHKDTQTPFEEKKETKVEVESEDKFIQAVVIEDHRQTQTESVEPEKASEHKDSQTEEKLHSQEEFEKKRLENLESKEMQTDKSNKHKTAQTDSRKTHQKNTQTDQEEKESEKKSEPQASEVTQTDLQMGELLKIISQAENSETLIKEEIEKRIAQMESKPEAQSAKKDVKGKDVKGKKGGKEKENIQGKGNMQGKKDVEVKEDVQGKEAGPPIEETLEVSVQTEPVKTTANDGETTVAKGMVEDIMMALRAEVAGRENVQEDDMEALNKNSIEQIKSLQDACSNLAREVDRIGVNLVTESVEESVEQANSGSSAADKDTLQHLMRELDTYQNNWLSVRRLLLCIDAHLKNAALYQMFHRQVDSLETSMDKFMLYLREKLKKAQDEGNLPEQFDPKLLVSLADECQMTESQLKAWGDLIVELSQKSKAVPPVHMRTEELSEPVPVKVLCNYSSNNVQLKEGDILILTDNTDQNSWKLETLNGDKVEMPAICCIILPPDVNTMKAAGRLETQHKEIGEKARETYTEEINKTCTIVTKYITEKESQGLSKEAKTALLDSLEAFSAYGMSSDERFVQKMEDIRTKIDAVKEAPSAGGGEASESSSDELTSTVSALKTITNVLKASKEEAERRRTMVQQGLLLESEETAWEEIAEVEAPEEVKVAVSVIREKMAVAETSRYESAMGEVRQSFVITGVMDTVTEEVLSLADAIERGIIDQANGVFIDNKLKEKYPIPVAMNAGYIVVASTNTFQARELKRSAGVITVNFHRENRPFNITGVLDPESHEVIPVNQAVDKGIYVKDQRKYVNTENGEEMKLEDAIDCGAIVVEYDKEHEGESKPEVTTKTFCITGVLDRKMKKRLNFDDAVDNNLLDKDTGTFNDTLTGQKYDLVAAMKKGYIRGTVLDDPDKIDQYMAGIRGRSGSVDSSSSEFSRFSGVE